LDIKPQHQHQACALDEAVAGGGVVVSGRCATRARDETITACFRVVI
jgi:hypothetical protein